VAKDNFLSIEYLCYVSRTLYSVITVLVPVQYTLW